MALPDDLNELAQQEVVYLTRYIAGTGQGSTTIFRGRLHQALSSNWVFNTSIGHNGVVGIDLNQLGQTGLLPIPRHSVCGFTSLPNRAIDFAHREHHADERNPEDLTD
jgi:hypothetical protein